MRTKLGHCWTRFFRLINGATTALVNCPRVSIATPPYGGAFIESASHKLRTRSSLNDICTKADLKFGRDAGTGTLIEHNPGRARGSPDVGATRPFRSRGVRLINRNRKRQASWKPASR